jgi:hypothetical protein
VANYAANTFSVLLNTTAAGDTTLSFAAQQTFATGAGPASIVTADLNGDGKPDVIAANYSSNTVSVMLSTTASSAATVNFSAQQTFASGSVPYAVTSADINGDGVSDLITANDIGNSVSVLLNTTVPGAATPSFAAQQTFATGVNPQALTAVDLNGDGRPDLVTTNYAANNVSVLLNTTVAGAATPSFATQKTFATGTTPVAITTADINGDGKPDLLVANQGAATVSVLLNTTAAGATTPSFAAQQTFATGSLPYSVAAADLNGDGEPDLIVANYSSNTVSVLLNTTAPGATTPSFAPQQTFATGTHPISVTAADVNGDGKPALVVANYGTSNVSVLLNTTAAGATTPSFAAQQTFAAGLNAYSITADDLNGDGKPDLVVANYGADTVSILLNTTAPGATTPSFAAQRTFATGSGPQSVTSVDLSGDGKPDLVIANSAANTVSVLFNKQFQALFAGSPATGTIVHDYIFADAF